MKLWLISQKVNDNYDTYDSAVVAAKTESDARAIRPNGDEWPRENTHRWRYSNWAYTPDQVEVQCIGEAALDQKSGVVLASFNAG